MTADPHMTWVAIKCSRFESHWMAMHRFLWMNALSEADLWHSLAGKAAPHIKWETISTRLTRMMHESPAAERFAQHLKTRSLEACFGPRNAALIARFPHIRFCAECLRECFHSPIFQLPNLTHCPMHGNELQSRCGHCGQPLGTVLPHSQAYGFPLACSACGTQFATSAPALEGFARGESTFHGVEQLLRKFRSTEFVGVSELGGLPLVANDYLGVCELLVCLARRPGGDALWARPSLRLHVSESRFRETPCWKFALERVHLPIQEDVEAACTVARAINRQVSRMVSRSCGHARTRQVDWVPANRPFEPVQPLLLMSPWDCPCCAVLDRWRAYAGKLFALRNLTRQIGFHIYEGVKDAFRERLSLHPEGCGSALISSFTWFADTMDKALVSIDEHPSKAPPALPMDVYRWDLRFHGYVFVFAQSKQQVHFAYALEWAAEALRRCAQRRSRGPLWHSPREVAPPERRLRRDTWYLPMAEHLWRNDHRWANYPVPGLIEIARSELSRDAGVAASMRPYVAQRP